MQDIVAALKAHNWVVVAFTLSPPTLSDAYHSITAVQLPTFST
jgi:hypothetical protein